MEMKDMVGEGEIATMIIVTARGAPLNMLHIGEAVAELTGAATAHLDAMIVIALHLSVAVAGLAHLSRAVATDGRFSCQARVH